MREAKRVFVREKEDLERLPDLEFVHLFSLHGHYSYDSFEDENDDIIFASSESLIELSKYMEQDIEDGPFEIVLFDNTYIALLR